MRLQKESGFLAIFLATAETQIYATAQSSPSSHIRTPSRITQRPYDKNAGSNNLDDSFQRLSRNLHLYCGQSRIEEVVKLRRRYSCVTY